MNNKYEEKVYLHYLTGEYYNLENLNIKSIEGIGKINLWKLKNREEALIYLPHSGSWERKFINELYNIGYEIKGKNYGYNR